MVLEFIESVFPSILDARGLLSWDQLFGLGGKTLFDVTVAIIDLGVSGFVSSLAMDLYQFLHLHHPPLSKQALLG